MAVKLLKLELIYGCLGKKFLVRTLFFAMALAATPVIYVARDAEPCDLTDYPDDCILEFSAPGWPFRTVSWLNVNRGPPRESSQTQVRPAPFYGPRSPTDPEFKSSEVPCCNKTKLWASEGWRQKVEFYSGIYRELFERGLLRQGFKSLSVGAGSGQSVLALRENGLTDAVGIDRRSLAPLVRKGDIHRLPFADNSFDFVFSGSFDRAPVPALLAFEIERTLKIGGIAAIVASRRRPNSGTSSDAVNSLSPIVALFRNTDVVHVGETRGPSHGTVIVVRKRATGAKRIKSMDECSPLKQNKRLANLAEPLKRKFSGNDVVYLPTVHDISRRDRFIYVDIGAGDFNSSIGGWFLPAYPKENQSFHVYALHGDVAGANLTGVKFVPRVGLQRTRPVRLPGVRNPSRGEIDGKGRDVAEWLKHSVGHDDFVVVRMDVGGLEFEHVNEMIRSGAMCLIDELFLRCHYSSKGGPQGTTRYYKRSYEDCKQMFQTLRDNGVFVHQWW